MIWKKIFGRYTKIKVTVEMGLSVVNFVMSLVDVMNCFRFRDYVHNKFVSGILCVSEKTVEIGLTIVNFVMSLIDVMNCSEFLDCVRYKFFSVILCVMRTREKPLKKV